MSTRIPAWAPYLCVFVGAALGTAVRASLEHVWPTDTGAWPWTTLIINCVGALLLGLLQEWLARGTAAWRTLAKVGLGTGVLGGFTTYSTLAMEALQSLRADALAVAFGYLALSVVLGVLFARAGLALGNARRRVSPAVAPRAAGAAQAGGEQSPSSRAGENK